MYSWPSGIPILNHGTRGSPMTAPAANNTAAVNGNNANVAGRNNSGTSFQMSQMRWLPSAMQRGQQPNGDGVVDPKGDATREHDGVVDNRMEGSRDGEGERESVMVEDEEGDGTTRAGDGTTGAGNHGDASQFSRPLGQSLPPGAVLHETAGGERDVGRSPYARRLTPKEEIKLFEICNRHAATFGERSKLCEWWRTVAREFTTEHGHPYSWHSVRRKVELVTKQRMKELAEQKAAAAAAAAAGGGGDEASSAAAVAAAAAAAAARNGMDEPLLSEWRKVVDEWIPTWERFTEAEKKRIEVRDSRGAGRPAKRRRSSSAGTNANAANAAAGTNPWQQSTPQKWPPGMPYSPVAFSTPPGVKLPAGYDTMFRNPEAAALGAPYAYPGQFGHPSMLPDGGAANSNVTTAILETLGKLNKHLEQSSSKADGQGTTTAASSSSSDAANNQSTTNASSGENQTTTSGISGDLAKLKSELHEELRKELRKDREQFEERLDSIQQTQEMILEMLRQEPGRE